MGADKATLMIAGKPLWSRQLDALRRMQPDKLLISGRFRPSWTPDDIEVVLDEPPSRGPLSGLAAALKEMQTTHLLALAVDLPEMSTEHLLTLWRCARLGLGVIPQWDNHYEPMAAIYPASVASMAERALAAGNLALQAFIERILEHNCVCVHPISISDRQLYRNVNSPEDLK
jgi:molybdopterin-guanine dinucleotide biosynthesis protein A